jgi:perosamine synthetase
MGTIKLFHPYIPEEFCEELKDVLSSGWIGQGAVTERFEKEFAEYVGAKYAVMTNSASSALNLAVEVSGLGPGDEVLTTPITFVSTNHAILEAGATPVFVDVDPRNLMIDLDKAEAAITPRTKAIIAVHYAGNPIDIYKLYYLAKKHNLKVIEDAAHACGATYDKRRIGSFGLTCFSFQAVKNLPVGDGGMVTTNDLEEYKKIRSLTWMGIDRTTYDRSKTPYKWEYDVTALGHKYHSNDIAACIGSQGLRELEMWNGHRYGLARVYHKQLRETGVQFLMPTINTYSSNHLFVIKVDNRDALHDQLLEKGIETGVHYKPNNHYSMYPDADLPETEKVYKRILSLPMHYRLSIDDAVRVCETLKGLL